MKIEIRFLSGARAGQRVELQAKDTIRLGRLPENDVNFDVTKDLDVSGRHAELRREADGFYLVDSGSSNGTFAGGNKVTRLRVASGQEVSFGKSGPRILILFGPEDGPVPPAPLTPVAGAASAPPAGPVGVAVAGAGAVVAPALAAPAAPAPAEAPASVGEAAAAAIGPERKVGARTVAMMIDAALTKAKEKPGGMGKSTVFLKSMVGQAVTKSTRRFKIVSVLLFALLLGAIGGFLALRHFERTEAKAEQERIRQEMAKIMEAQKGATSEEKAKLAEKLDQLNRKLAAATPMTGGKEIVQRNKRAVFLMTSEHPVQGAKGFCTAFAVRKRILATNAHCIIAYDQLREQGNKMYLVMNQEPTKIFQIVKVARHPDYHKPQKSISHDVGLVQVDSDLGDLVELATVADLKALSAGDLMYTYGFPGRLANPKSPDATLVQGVIGRITKLDGELGPFEESKLIQHSAFTSGGTSGSPVFTQDNKVIAVNTGGYVEPGSMQVMDPLTGRAGNLVVAKQLAGYNFGIRIDVLRGLLDQVKD